MISIVIPVYNVSDYILECIESVVAQTYTGSMECILVDDCGQDNSILIAEDFIRIYDGSIEFSVIHHERNKGLSGARNTGIAHARGEYIYFLDSDDIITNDCIELLVSLAKKYKNVDIVQGSTYVNGNSWRALPKYLEREYSEDREWIRENMCVFSISDPAWNRLVRAEFIKENKLYFAEGLIQEDTLWSYTLQKKIRSIAFCYKDTYIYRTNPNGIMKSNVGLKEAISFAKICNVVFADLKSCKEIKSYEIRYLELNAIRIGRTGGNEGLSRMDIYHNPIFKLLNELNSKYYEGNKWEKLKGKIRDKLVVILRLMLCNRLLLSL